MVLFCLAHVPSDLCIAERNAAQRKGRPERDNRRLATEVDHGSRPVENDQIEAIANGHQPVPHPNSSATTSSPIANPVDAPEPLVIITMRTLGAGASMNMLRSALDG